MKKGWDKWKAFTAVNTAMAGATANKSAYQENGRTAKKPTGKYDEDGA